MLPEKAETRNPDGAPAGSSDWFLQKNHSPNSTPRKKKDVQNKSLIFSWWA